MTLVTITENWVGALVAKAEKKVNKEGGGEGMLFQFAKRTVEDPEIAVKCLGKWPTSQR